MIFKNNDVAFAIIAACNLSKYCIKTLEMDDKNFSNQILQGFTATDGEQKPCDNVNPNQDARIEPTFKENKTTLRLKDFFPFCFLVFLSCFGVFEGETCSSFEVF